MRLTSSEAVLAISALSIVATAVSSVLAVRVAGRNQRQVAHDERVADRWIETYLELLGYLLDAQKKDPSLRGGLGLPGDLELRMMVFASTDVQALAWTYLAALGATSSRVANPRLVADAENRLLARVKLELAEGRSTPGRSREESLVALIREWPGSRR
jgi:hypothetical protein